MKKTGFLLLLFTQVTLSADLGVWGEVYPIQEQDMIVFIKSRLTVMEADGTLAKKQEETKNRVMANVRRPPPVQGLVLADKDSRHHVDPGFVVSDDLKDHKGRIFAKKGEVINPLAYVPFEQKLFFLDADDARQLAWLKAQQPAFGDKIILVKGDIREAGEYVNAPVYFDQYGQLTQKFRLYAFPAIVQKDEDKRRLRVDTVSLKEKEE